MRKALIVATLAAAVTLTAGYAIAQMHRHGNPEHMAKMVTAHVNATLDELKATDAQRTRILAVKDTMLAEAQKLHEGHAAVHQQLRGMFDAETFDRQAARALVDQKIEELRASAYKAVDAIGDVHDTLTPEQRTQLEQQFDKMHHPEQ